MGMRKPIKAAFSRYSCSFLVDFAVSSRHTGHRGTRFTERGPGRNFAIMWIRSYWIFLVILSDGITGEQHYQRSDKFEYFFFFFFLFFSHIHIATLVLILSATVVATAISIFNSKGAQGVCVSVCLAQV